MPKLDELFPSKWLRYSDLDESGNTLTITDVTVELVGEDTKPCIYFEETKKVLGCNKTNAKTIGGILGQDTDDWIGRQIVLFATQCDYAGEQVDCIRVNKRQTEALQKKAQKPAKAVPSISSKVKPMTQAEVDDGDDIPF